MHLPKGSWFKVDGLSQTVSPEQLQAWLHERGICLPLEQIDKTPRFDSATICFTPDDFVALFNWLLGEDTLTDVRESRHYDLKPRFRVHKRYADHKNDQLAMMGY